MWVPLVRRIQDRSWRRTLSASSPGGLLKCRPVDVSTAGAPLVRRARSSHQRLLGRASGERECRVLVEVPAEVLGPGHQLQIVQGMPLGVGRATTSACHHQRHPLGLGQPGECRPARSGTPGRLPGRSQCSPTPARTNGILDWRLPESVWAFSVGELGSKQLPLWCGLQPTRQADQN